MFRLSCGIWLVMNGELLKLLELERLRCWKFESNRFLGFNPPPFPPKNKCLSLSEIYILCPSPPKKKMVENGTEMPWVPWRGGFWPWDILTKTPPQRTNSQCVHLKIGGFPPFQKEISPNLDFHAFSGFHSWKFSGKVTTLPETNSKSPWK